MKRFAALSGIFLVMAVVGLLFAGQFNLNGFGVDESGNVTCANIACQDISGGAVSGGVFTCTLLNGVTSTGVRTTMTNSTYGVVVASASTSSAQLCFGGAFAALPTTGFPAHSIIVLTTDNDLYISTETVAGAFSWVRVGSQS